MEIVQIFILNSMAFERSQSFYLLQSFMKIYIKIVLFFLNLNNITFKEII